MTTVGIFHGLLGGIGGGERVALSLAKGLIKSGYRVKVYAIASLVDNSSVRLFSETIPQGAEIIALSPLRIKAFAVYQNLLSEHFIKRVERECDVVVQTGGGYQPIMKSNQRRISYCHGVWTHEGLRHDNKYQTGFWKLYFMPFGWLMKRRFARIREANMVFVANSNYTRQHLLDVWKINEQDLHLVYPPINITKWNNGKNEKRSGIVNLGRFSPEKKHLDMFEIVKDIDTTLTIIGGTPNFTHEMYLRKIQQLAPKNVEFVKNISDHQIAEQLHRAKVYLHAGKETFGISVVESIAAGCIPVVPNNSAHAETVPFEELRYDSITGAKQIIRDTLNGKFDILLPRLRSHIQQFDEEIFNKKMEAIVEMVGNGRAS